MARRAGQDQTGVVGACNRPFSRRLCLAVSMGGVVTAGAWYTTSSLWGADNLQALAIVLTTVAGALSIKRCCNPLPGARGWPWGVLGAVFIAWNSWVALGVSAHSTNQNTALLAGRKDGDSDRQKGRAQRAGTLEAPLKLLGKGDPDPAKDDSATPTKVLEARLEQFTNLNSNIWDRTDNCNVSKRGAVKLPESVEFCAKRQSLVALIEAAKARDTLIQEIKEIDGAIEKDREKNGAPPVSTNPHGDRAALLFGLSADQAKHVPHWTDVARAVILEIAVAVGPELVEGFLLALFGLSPIRHSAAAQPKPARPPFFRAHRKPDEPAVEAPTTPAAVEPETPAVEAPSPVERPLGIKARERAERKAKQAEIDTLTVEFIEARCDRIAGEETPTGDIWKMWLSFVASKGVAANAYSRKAWSLSMQRHGLGKGTANKNDTFIGLRPKRAPAAAAHGLRLVSAR
jgi:hypothetical protein